jgi:hypothetical protein
VARPMRRGRGSAQAEGMSSDVSRYATEYGGSRVEVEVDESGVVSAEVRLVIDGVLAGEDTVRLGSRLDGHTATGPVHVRVALGVFGGVRECVLVDGARELPLRRVRRTGDGDPDDDLEILDLLL